MRDKYTLLPLALSPSRLAFSLGIRATIVYDAKPD
jgi:hypothetical protein